jgi:calcium/calmodulin-dependent 3',5'-cyclic nucleotide phosphodiesterase
MIQFILSTDMSEHFKLVKEFETRYQERGEAFGQENEDVRLLCCMVIHTADFSGGAKEFKVSRRWS